MKNELQSGRTIVVTRAASAAVAAGGLVKVNGNFFGVAVNAMASTGDTSPAAVEGVYALPKLAEGIVQGTEVYWNGTAVGAAVTGSIPVGMSWEQAATGDTTVPVKLNFAMPNATGLS
jgi:predicted RecA/RadA family phage recombinase